MGRAGHVQKKRTKHLAAAAWIAVAVVAAGLIFTNAAVLFQPGKTIVNAQEARETGADCILVLGARVDGGVPGAILQSRLETGVELYRLGAAPKLFLTGDGGQHRYDEVDAMRKYALDAGVRAQDIVVDDEGFDTYSSIYRAKSVFGFASAIIVTQPYHLPRALYIAHELGLAAFGVETKNEAEGQWFRDLREIAARAKDWAVCILKPAPKQFG